MRSLYSSFLNLPYLLILELIIMLFFLQGILRKVSSWYGTEKSSPHVPFIK